MKEKTKKTMMEEDDERIKAYSEIVHALKKTAAVEIINRELDSSAMLFIPVLFTTECMEMFHDFTDMSYKDIYENLIDVLRSYLDEVIEGFQEEVESKE